jgi:hypothetical protein
VLHRCIEGEKVGVDGSKIVDVDRRHDPRPGGTPVPSGERGREPPSSFFLGIPPRWEESSPSGPWPPWQRRGGSPSEIGSPSLFSSVSRSPDLALHGFLNSRRFVTPIALKFLHDFFSINYLSCARRRAPTALRGGYKIPGHARGCPVRPGVLCSLWDPVYVDSTSQKS